MFGYKRAVIVKIKLFKSLKTQVIDFHHPHLAPKKTVLSLGCFDGVHLGHKEVIKQLVNEAREHKAPSCLCMFDPLPFQILNGHDLKRIFTIEESLQLLKPFGLDFLCIIPFSREFSRLSALAFVKSFIVPQFFPIKVVVGYDFVFAHKREGNVSTLKELGTQFGFKVKQVKVYLHRKEPVSSSRIRKCLSMAKMKDLKTLLGHPFFIKAKVVKGDSRGRELGFPTANLEIRQKELPALGVYGGKVKIADVWYKAVINIGRRPTFSANQDIPLVEVHVISSDFDLYDQQLDVQLDFYIRKEKAFSKPLELQTAIKQDIQKTLSFSY